MLNKVDIIAVAVCSRPCMVADCQAVLQCQLRGFFVRSFVGNRLEPSPAPQTGARGARAAGAGARAGAAVVTRTLTSLARCAAGAWVTRWRHVVPGNGKQRCPSHVLPPPPASDGHFAKWPITFYMYSYLFAELVLLLFEFVIESQTTAVTTKRHASW